MFQWMKALCARYKEIVVYLVFGVLTTIVNYAVYLPLFNFLRLSATLSNLLAWAVAVLFAFITNKLFVFGSQCWTPSVVLPEFLKFVGCRIFSGIAETLILLLTVDLLQYNGNLWKIVTGVIVIVLNYFGSKYFAFMNKKEKQP